MGLARGTPVVTGAADGPLGNLGTRATAPGVVSLSIGTSAAARVVLPRPAPDPAGGLFSYALTEDRWVVGGAVSNGADVLRWAGAALDAGASDQALLARAARVPAGSGGVVLLPYLLPERAPLWSAGAAGAYLGLRREHTRGHLLRAAVEGVCLELARVVGRLAALSPVTDVRATGGALRAPLWRGSLAAALARPLRVGADADGCALGAAALGLHALGGAATPEEAVETLAGPPGTEEVVVPPPADVAALAGVRARAADLLAALVSAGSAAAPAAAPR
ncbi:FGGY-family carbohydrate kinase [Geodermatophilus sp. SYSU D00815]